MTETTETTETAKARCGHPTKSGPCVRPEGHTPNGHISQKNIDTKTANFRAKKHDDPEYAEKAAEREEARRAAKLGRLQAEAAKIDMKLVPLTKKEIAERASA